MTANRTTAHFVAPDVTVDVRAVDPNFTLPPQIARVHKSSGAYRALTTTHSKFTKRGYRVQLDFSEQDEDVSQGGVLVLHILEEAYPNVPVCWEGEDTDDLHRVAEVRITWGAAHRKLHNTTA